MNARRIRRPTQALAVAVVGLFVLLVGAAAAGNYTGTPRADHMRGTPAADRIDGKGGNDVLLGLGGNDVLIGGAGNDRLVGGAGTDKLNCGPGKDTAVADKQDKVSASCEVVIGLPKPSLSIADASVAEGNSGTSTVSFAVTLSAAGTKPVSVDFATANGTATAPGDYAAASGTLTFAPGETSKTISISVVSDTTIEQNETFTVTLSSSVNATIAKGTATGTITNDDTAAPVTAGDYKGATQNGNYVFFTVTSNRAISGFRVNDLPDECDPGGIIYGGENFGDSTFPIGPNGSFSAQGSWDGSDVQGDVEWTHWDGKITGSFNAATTATGTILMNYELNYQGTHFRCSSGEVRWSASLLG